MSYVATKLTLVSGTSSSSLSSSVVAPLVDLCLLPLVEGAIDEVSKFVDEVDKLDLRPGRFLPVTSTGLGGGGMEVAAPDTRTSLC